MRYLPRLNAKYWLVLVAASIFGTNTGDLLADDLGYGHFRGLPLLIILFATILAAQKFIRLSTMIFFWAGIITVRTAATNVGDGFWDHGITYRYSIPGISIAMLAAATAYAMRRTANPPPEGTLRTDALYWLCMLLAGILGTLCGDYVSFSLDLGLPLSTLIWSAAVAAMFLVWKQEQLRMPYLYWLTVVLIRSAGTAAGDLFAEIAGLRLSTLLTGLIFWLLVIFFYEHQKTNVVRIDAGAS